MTSSEKLRPEHSLPEDWNPLDNHQTAEWVADRLESNALLTSQDSLVTLTKPERPESSPMSSRQVLVMPDDPVGKYFAMLDGIGQQLGPAYEHFAVFLKDGSDLIGGIQFGPVDPEEGDDTMVKIKSFMDDNPRLGKGHVADAIILLKEYVVEKLGKQGVIVSVKADQEITRTKLEKAGFVAAGQDTNHNPVYRFSKTAAPATPAMESADEAAGVASE